MAAVDDILRRMRADPKGIAFRDLCKVCGHFFGAPRQSGTSHRVYKNAMAGRPTSEHPEFKR